jgi:hypothetical protein
MAAGERIIALSWTDPPRTTKFPSEIVVETGSQMAIHNHDPFRLPKINVYM